MVILASTTLMLLLYLKSDPSLSLTVGMQSVSHGKKKSVNSSQLQENSKMTSFLTDETNKIPTKRARKLIFFSYICWLTWTRLSAVLGDSLARILDMKQKNFAWLTLQLEDAYQLKYAHLIWRFTRATLLNNSYHGAATAFANTARVGM